MLGAPWWSKTQYRAYLAEKLKYLVSDHRSDIHTYTVYSGLSFSFIRETVPARYVHLLGEMDILYTSLDTDQVKVAACLEIYSCTEMLSQPNSTPG